MQSIKVRNLNVPVFLTINSCDVHVSKNIIQNIVNQRGSKIIIRHRYRSQIFKALQKPSFLFHFRSASGSDTETGSDDAFVTTTTMGVTNGRPSSIDRLGKLSYNPDEDISEEDELTSEDEEDSDSEEPEIQFNKPGDAKDHFKNVVKNKILIPMWLSKNFDEKWNKLKDDTLKHDEGLKEKTRKVAGDYGMMSKLPKDMANKLEPVAVFGFASSKYRVGSDKSRVFIDVRRQGGLKHAVKLSWNTRENTALQGKHFDRAAEVQ